MKIFQESCPIGQSMSTLLLQSGCMKRYSTRHRRPTLLPVPYSPRPDRIERGLRMLRALRLSLAMTPDSDVRPQQCEFQFALQK
ncbi:hypothetical protein BH20VER1_BH20VER1_18040 [soil metagenome]